MIEVIPPTKQFVVHVIEGLLSGQYSREEVVQWRRAVSDHFNYYGPGTLMLPLTNADGYWEFCSFAILMARGKFDSNVEESYFIREGDLREWLANLLRTGPQHERGKVHRLRWTTPSQSANNYHLLAYKDPCGTTFTNMGVTTVRGMCNDLGMLSEFALIEEAEQLFFFDRSYGLHHDGEVNVFGNNGCLAQTVAGLLDKLGLDIDQLDWVSKLVSDEPYTLWRLDDNNHHFVVSEHSDYVEAFLQQRHYERKGHKQLYFLRRATESTRAP